VLGSEFRGIWADGFGQGFLDECEARELVRDCRRYNFNALIVEMRRRGDAFYIPKPPNMDSRVPIIATNFDALAEIIREAHNGVPRVEVHCWVVSHFVWARDYPPWEPTHVVNAHPEFLTKDFFGQRFIEKGYFLDPGNPDANQSIHDVVEDIVRRYDIDGLHWDYCRYPTQDSGYNEMALQRYLTEFGLNDRPKPRDARFCEWRRRQVTDFLRWVNADMLEIKPDLVISASVFSSTNDACSYRFQDWPAWLREGVLDCAMPMDFSPENNRICFPRAQIAASNEGLRHVYLGLGGYLNAKANLLKQMRYARDLGLPGTVLYNYRLPESDSCDQAATLEFVKENFQPEWISTPDLRWKRSRGILKGVVLNKRGTPIYNAEVSIGKARNTQLTEPHGSFAFFDLPPGEYEISAKKDGQELKKQARVDARRVVNLIFGLSL
jgi:uncharacterized lipoprotein YddW (UPF0748 family)